MLHGLQAPSQKQDTSLGDTHSLADQQHPAASQPLHEPEEQQQQQQQQQQEAGVSAPEVSSAGKIARMVMQTTARLFPGRIQEEWEAADAAAKARQDGPMHPVNTG